MDFTNWLTYLVSLFCGGLCACCLWNVFRYFIIPRRDFIEDDLDKWLAAGDKKRHATHAIICAVLLAIIIPGYYFFRGPGTPTPSTPVEAIGRSILDKDVPDEKDQETLDAEADKKRSPELKRQFEGAEKDREEANEYLRRARERWKETKGEDE